MIISNNNYKMTINPLSLSSDYTNSSNIIDINNLNKQNDIYQDIRKYKEEKKSNLLNSNSNNIANNLNRFISNDKKFYNYFLNNPSNERGVSESSNSNSKKSYSRPTISMRYDQESYFK
jgi:hypothetical protein